MIPEKPEPQDRNSKTTLGALLDLSSMGIFLVAATFVGGGIGYFLDKKVFGTFPWLSIIFLILGIVAGFRKIFEMARRFSGDDGGSGPAGRQA